MWVDGRTEGAREEPVLVDHPCLCALLEVTGYTFGRRVRCGARCGAVFPPDRLDSNPCDL